MLWHQRQGNPGTDLLWNVYQNRHFCNRREVLTPEYLNQALDGKNIFSFLFVDWTWFFNQLVGLGDVRNSLCDRLNTDLIYVTVNPGPQLGYEAGDADCPISGCNSVKIGFYVLLFAVAGPYLPIPPPP